MKSILVSPSRSAGSSAPSPHPPAVGIEAPPVQAFVAALPALPPFTGGSEWSHNDPLLFTPSPSSYGDSAPALSLSGYELPFVESIDEDLICVICSLVCRDAVETSCSHIFCSSCLSRWLHTKSDCVTCRTPLRSSDIHPSGFLRRKILSLEVRCRNHEAGCRWKGEVRYMSQHMRKECLMQRLIHASEEYVDAPVHSASSLTPVLAEVESHFPPSILLSLPLPALYRLASFHTFHALNTGETHPSFDFGTSCVLTSYQSQTQRSDLNEFFGVQRHQQCRQGECSTIFEREDLPNDTSSLEDETNRRQQMVTHILSTLSKTRAQYVTIHTRLARVLATLPVRTLQSFLHSKGLDSRLHRGVEKSELVAMVIDFRDAPDTDEARRTYGESPNRFKEKGRREQIPDEWFHARPASSSGSSSASPHDDGIHQFHDAATLMNQLHAAALQAHTSNLGGIGALHAQAHAQAHFHQHALHAAQHMLSLGALNGVSHSGGGGGGATFNLQGGPHGMVLSMTVGPEEQSYMYGASPFGRHSAEHVHASVDGSASSSHRGRSPRTDHAHDRPNSAGSHSHSSSTHRSIEDPPSYNEQEVPSVDGGTCCAIM